MTSDRFGKDEESEVGPGYYEIPTTLDDHAPLIAPGERFQDPVEQSGFQIYDEQPEKQKQLEKAAAPESKRRALSNAPAKENRIAQKNLKAEKFSQEPLELEQLRRRLTEEEKRRAQAEVKSADLALAKKAAANAHAQMQSNERKMEQQQKEIEDLNLAKKEAQKRASELEAEKVRGKKALHEKEQQMAALQKSLTLAKAQLEERSKKLDEQQGDSDNLRRELGRLQKRREELPTPNRKKMATGSPLKASPARSSMEVNETIISSLEKRFAEQNLQTEGQLKELAEAQGRMTEIVLQGAADSARELSDARERLEMQEEELIKRRSQLYFALEQSKEIEAHLDAAVVVREANLVAMSAVGEGLQKSLCEAEDKVLLLEGEIAKKNSEVATLSARCEEIADLRHQVATQKQEASRLASEAAEVRGKLFTSEQALLASQAAREDLQRRLSAVSEQEKAKDAEVAANAERLQAELYEALATRAGTEEALAKMKAEIGDLSQERDVLVHSNKALEQKADEAQQNAKDAIARAAAKEEEAQEVEALKALAAESESHKARAQQNEKDLEALGKECEEQQRQNRELLESMQALQKDFSRLEAENRTLRAGEEQRESAYEREMGRHAQITGHTNQRQKIQHLLQLKEEAVALKAELKKARHRIAQLEIAEVSAKVTTASTSRRLSSGSVQTTPMSARKPPLAARRASCGGTGTVQRESADAARHHALKEHAYERLLTEHKHLVNLLERATMCEGSSEVLRRLRELAAADRLQSSRKPSPSPLLQQQVAGLPSTPQRRRPVDGLSDLGDQSEVPDATSATSEAGAEDAEA
eukprot:CAMPEP_0197656420 /NCGR_PEP_ID=MMETSP1338-20131121/41788_1 /TAXON_ID=43686 ORGANISM="Pelagodinium beii, Strain RCC1491" /NCGR_SAMPLE_ID=MMETSP1338 /ASSEMBLY_ACC=CAM_ASM_000754 /LENGTH=819 /DNA_ID=CAMNT_0043232413 /DNA_START=91 /DNA_END=2550 /DNA_ORIENTATION=-